IGSTCSGGEIIVDDLEATHAALDTVIGHGGHADRSVLPYAEPLAILPIHHDDHTGSRITSGSSFSSKLAESPLGRRKLARPVWVSHFRSRAGISRGNPPGISRRLLKSRKSSGKEPSIASRTRA